MIGVKSLYPNLFCMTLSLRTRQARHQCGTVLLQPASGAPKVGQDPLHLSPEAGGVIHLPAVAELMHHHIVEDLAGGQEQQTVEVEVALCRAAAPLASLPAHADAAVIHADLRREESGALGKNLPPALLKTVQLLLCQRSDLRLGGDPTGGLAQLLRDPVPILCRKSLDFPFGTAKRGADEDLPVGADLQRQRFPPAADELNLRFSILPEAERPYTQVLY